MELPAAHRVPPEVISDIIEQLRRDNVRACGEFTWTFGALFVQPLLRCSLVCRHWAQICRKTAFESIIVRSEAHFNHLLQLLSAPSVTIPPLADCIQTISVEWTGTEQRPWVHRISQIQLYTSLAPQWSKLDINDVTEAWRSLYGPIPRTLPGGMFQFETLAFSNVRFRTVYDLLRVVRDLPQLRNLSCRDTSFDNETVLWEDGIRISRRNVAALLAPFKLVLDNYASPCLNRERFVLALCGMCYCRFSEMDERLWRNFRDVFSLFPFEGVDNSVSLKAWPHGIEYYNLDIHGELEMTHFGVRLKAHSNTVALSSFDWSALEGILTRLDQTPNLLLEFYGKPAFRTVLDAVVDGHILRRLHSAGKVDVTYNYHGIGGFRRISMGEVLALQTDYAIDGHHIVLKASQRFSMSWLESENERKKYLRGLLTPTELTLDPK